MTASHGRAMQESDSCASPSGAAALGTLQGASRSAWRRNACVRGRHGRLGLVRFGRARAGVYEHYAGRGLFRARRSWIGIERESRAPHPGLPPNAWCSWRRGRDSTGSGTPDRSRRSSRGDHVLTQAPVWRLRSEWVVLPIRGDDTQRRATARLAPCVRFGPEANESRGGIAGAGYAGARRWGAGGATRCGRRRGVRRGGRPLCRRRARRSRGLCLVTRQAGRA